MKPIDFLKEYTECIEFSHSSIRASSQVAQVCGELTDPFRDVSMIPHSLSNADFWVHANFLGARTSRLHVTYNPFQADKTSANPGAGATPTLQNMTHKICEHLRTKQRPKIA